MIELAIFGVIGTLVVTMLWQTFGSDVLHDVKSRYLEDSSNRDKAAKLAQIKLVSDDRKDIEKFVSDNANYLSNETVKKLVARIEAIKADRIIMDSELGKQIDALGKKA